MRGRLHFLLVLLRDWEAELEDSGLYELYGHPGCDGRLHLLQMAVIFWGGEPFLSTSVTKFEAFFLSSGNKFQNFPRNPI